MLWGVMSEFCAASSCPIMSAGEKYQYRWRTFDASSTSTHYRMHSTSTITSGEKSNMSDQHISHRQHTISLSAPDYIERVLDWCRQVLDDPRLFPTQPGATFDRDFMTVCRTLFKRLFRVYAHIYASHLDVIHMLDASEHLNTSFKHFVLFVREFELLDSKELRPAADLIQSLTKTPV
jgi:MOB kinase activator 1